MVFEEGIVFGMILLLLLFMPIAGGIIGSRYLGMV
jgi:hypothetical protein